MRNERQKVGETMITPSDPSPLAGPVSLAVVGLRRAHGPRRVAMLSVHTSPLDQPGTGDAGGMNVYVVELSKRLALAGTSVEIFTRATDRAQQPTTQLADGVLVHHVAAGPLQHVEKYDLPAQLCALTAGVLRAEASRPHGWYDVVHSHYWLSGQVGSVASERWNVPLIHSMHTMAKVKNLSLAQGDSPEPSMRVMGEQQVVDSSDRIIANTTTEAQELIRLYGADPHQTAVVHPGVDLGVFSPGDSTVARARVGLPQDARVLLFVGRIQPLKAPDVIIRLTADLVERDPTLRHSLLSVICGGPSGAGPERLDQLHKLAADLGVSDVVRFLPPANRADLADLYRAADVVLVPSHSESFGLVAIEAQACGTPVVAADVGGLATAVRHNNSGLLVGDHEPSSWHDAVAGLLADDHHLERLARGARHHAQDFSWTATAAATLAVYREAISQREEGLHGGTNQTIGSIA